MEPEPELPSEALVQLPARRLRGGSGPGQALAAGKREPAGAKTPSGAASKQGDDFIKQTEAEEALLRPLQTASSSTAVTLLLASRPATAVSAIGPGPTAMEGVAEAASASAGALASALFLYPLDLVKTRLQSQLAGDGASQLYSGIGDVSPGTRLWRCSHR